MRILFAFLLLLSPAIGQDIFQPTGRYAEPAESGCYLMVFTTRTCGPCNRFRTNELQSILKAGHNVEVIDLDDEENNRLYSKDVSLVPTFWIVDRKTKATIWKRTSASMKAAELLTQLRFASSGKTAAPGAKSCKCSDLCTCGCNDGKQCSCGNARAATARDVPLLKAQRSSNPILKSARMTHSQMVSLHNQLHGGGSRTWPGDLAEHLRTVHGVVVK